jgi:hypothetical protein
MDAHFRYTRNHRGLRAHDGTLAEHHIEPCLLCENDRLLSVVGTLCDYTGELWYGGGLRAGSAHEETVRTIRGHLGGVRDLIDGGGRA